MAKKEIDITKSGPMSFKTLQAANNSAFARTSPEFQSFINNIEATYAPTSLYDARNHAEQLVASGLSDSNTAWGESMFDIKTANEHEFQQLGDIRAENQPWYSKVGAGLAKGAVLAGTTFLDGTIGFLIGASEAAKEGDWSKLWDNDFSRAMKEVNDWAEKEMPNYYTQEEQENPWRNIFSANFLGDKLIKNLGFMVGAFYGGGIYAGAARGATKGIALGAKALGSSMKAVKNIAGASPIVGSVVGAGMSAVNEGRIEALNNSTDWANHQKLMLDERHAQYLQAIEDNYKGTEMYDALISNAHNSYAQTLAKIEEDRAKMGNADLLMNLPVLLASNIIQWGKMFGEGLGTARRVNNIVKRAGKYETTLTAAGGVRKGIINSLSEGTEEIAQKAASNISGIYYEGDVTNFHKSMMDPEAEQEHIDWSKAFANGILETVKDPHAWEEFLIGTLSGALGMPSFGKANTKNAYIGKDRSFGFTGGLAGEIMENRELMQREQALADYMNTRIQSPEFLNYYRGLIRHKKYQNDMNKAIEEGNGFDYKNAEYNQFVSDIIMFDNAGKLEDLKTLIGDSFDTSDENLDAIVRNTTSIGPNGVLVGPFAQYATKDTDGNIISNFGNEDSKKEMIKKLTDKKDSMMKSIEEYSKAKFEIEEVVGDKVSEEQLGELVWLKGAVDNLAERSSEMHKELTPTFNKILSSLMRDREYFAKERESEGIKGKKVKRGDKEVIDFSVSEGYEKALEDEKVTNANIAFVEGLINSKYSSKTGFWSSHKKTVENLKNLVKKNPEITATEATEFSKKLDDIVKAEELSKSFNDKLTEYINAPEKQVEDNQKAEAQVVEQGQKGARNAIASRFNWNGEISDIAKVIEENEEDIKTAGGMDQFMAQLTPEQRSKVAEARKLLKGISGLRSLIDDSDLSDEQKRIANSIIDDNLDSSSIEELASKVSEDLAEGAVSKKMIESASSAEIDDNIKLNTINEIEAKLKEFFDDNIEKAAKSADEAEKIQRRKEKKLLDEIERLASQATAAEEKAIQEGELDTSALPEDDTNQGDDINPTMVAELNKTEGKPTKTATPIRPQGKAGKAYDYRPQLSEMYMHGVDNETYLDFIEKHPEAIPAGVDDEAFKQYIREVHQYLKREGAFTFVNGTDSNWKMEVGDTIVFEHNKELSEKAGTPVVVMIVEKQDKRQVVGTLPTALDFSSKSKYVKKDKDGNFITDKKGNWVWTTSPKTVGETRADQKKLYDDIVNSTESTEPTQVRTKVTSLMGGNIEFGNTRKSVSDIFGSEVPVIAVYGENTELTSGNIKLDQQFITPDNAKPWQIYVMIPANNGKYLPAMCASKPWIELSPDDWYVKETIEAFKKVISSTKDMKENTKALYKWLNVPGLGVQVGKQTNKWEQITDVANATHVRVSFRSAAEKVMTVAIPIIDNQISDTQIREAIATILKNNPNITTNVDIKRLTDSEYRANIAKYLITNIASSTPHTVNDWFTYSPTDIEKGVVSQKRAEELANPEKVVEHGAEKKGTLNGEDVTIDKDGTVRTIDGQKVSVQMGEEINMSGGINVSAPSGTSVSLMGFGIGQPSNISTSESDNLFISKKRRGRRMEVTEKTSSERMSSEDRINRDIARIKKMFPQLSESGRIIVVNGLHAISENGNAKELYGYFRDGILYINSNSPMGTVFHEAFHYVTEALLDESERKILFEEAEKRYGMSDTLALEERLAEDFRDYVNGYEDRTLVGKLKTFFKNLKYIINNIAGNINYIDSLFHSIYKNGFSTRKETVEDSFQIQLMKYRNNRVAYERLSYDIQESLKAKGISKESFNSLTIEGKEDLIFCLL